MTEIKDFILNAIHEGIAQAPVVYMNQLEEQLKNDVAIQEADGDIAALIEEQMTDEIIEFCEIDEEAETIQFNEELYVFTKECEVIAENALNTAINQVINDDGFKSLYESIYDQMVQEYALPSVMKERAAEAAAKAAANKAIDDRAQTMIAGYKSGMDSAAKAASPADGPLGKLGVTQGTVNKVTYHANKAIDDTKSYASGVGKTIASKAQSAYNQAGQYASSAGKTITGVAQKAHETLGTGGLAAAGVAGAAIAGAGIYGLYKYLNSPKKIASAIEKTKAFIANAKKAGKPAAKYEKKLQVLNMKLAKMSKKK